MLHVRQLLMLMFGEVVSSSYTHGAFVPGKVLVECRRASVTPLVRLQPAWANTFPFHDLKRKSPYSCTSLLTPKQIKLAQKQTK